MERSLVTAVAKDGLTYFGLATSGKEKDLKLEEYVIIPSGVVDPETLECEVGRIVREVMSNTDLLEQIRTAERLDSRSMLEMSKEYDEEMNIEELAEIAVKSLKWQLTHEAYELLSKKARYRSSSPIILDRDAFKIHYIN